MSKDDVVKVALSKEEIAILLDVLHFAQRTSKILVNEEIMKGSPGGVKKMTAIMDNSVVFYKIFYRNFEIGEPPTDIIM